MTRIEAPSAAERYQVLADVEAMRRCVGLDAVEVRLEPTYSQCASVRASRGSEGTRMTMSWRLAKAPVSVRRKVIAHEFGHVLNGDTHMKAMSDLRAGVGAGALLGVAVIAVVEELSVGGMRHGLLGAGGPMVTLLMLGVLAWYHRPLRRRELAADRTSWDHFGCGYDREVATWMRRNWYVDLGPLQVVGTHPSSRRRLRAVREAGYPNR